ncbi:MAG: hypothetical protein BRD48_03520 [Bacteroidetes bacterium QS_9_68_14]|nr:MAG: hypothetical protein BRD48_03520 [Bacteroidetes bacterium QS_9_68_14]
MFNLDASVDSKFQERDDGTTVFFPRGAFGSGYELPSPEKAEQARGLVRRYLRLVIGLGALGGGAAGVLGALVAHGPAGVGAVAAAVMVPLMGGVWGVHEYRLRRFTEDLPVADESFSTRAAFCRQARAESWARLWIQEAGALGFVALGAWLLFAVEGVAWIGALNVAFFGLCAAVFAAQIGAKARPRRFS